MVFNDLGWAIIPSGFCASFIFECPNFRHLLTVSLKYGQFILRILDYYITYIIIIGIVTMAYIDKSMILLVHVSLVLVLVVIFIGQVLYCTPFSTKNCELIVIGNSFAALICVCCLFKIYFYLQLEITVKSEIWTLEIQICLKSTVLWVQISDSPMCLKTKIWVSNISQKCLKTELFGNQTAIDSILVKISDNHCIII